MEEYIYKPKGVCSSKFIFDIEDGVILDVKIFDGCPGNLFGISKLIVGMKVLDVINKFEGVTCGRRSTSCPDQIARALQEYLAK